MAVSGTVYAANAGLFKTTFCVSFWLMVSVCMTANVYQLLFEMSSKIPNVDGHFMNSKLISFFFADEKFFIIPVAECMGLRARREVVNLSKNGDECG
jgi:hypothetical protein